MVSDGYTHWVILQVTANTLMSVAPVASMASVYVAPTVREAVAILSRGDVAAMPLVGDNLHDLRLALMRYRVVV
jgi:hypothetical protein